MRLQVYIGDDAFGGDPAALPWVLRDAGGRVAGSGVAAPAAMPHADRCEAVLAGSRVLLTSVNVPSRGGKLRQLALFAVEDQLVSEPESVHVALGAAGADGAQAVAVVDRDRLASLLRMLAQAGIALHALWPETQLPPLAPRSWSLAWDGDRGVLRTGLQAGMAVEAGSDVHPPPMLEYALREARRRNATPDRLVVLLKPGATPPEHAAWGAALGVEVEAGGPWDWSDAAFARDANRIDLLQGEFAPAGTARELWSKFKPVAVLAALLLLLNGGAVLADWLMLRHERDRIKADMESVLRTAFPETNVIVDAPLQMRRKLAEMRAAAGAAGASDLLPLLARVSGALSQKANASVKAIEYDRGTLTLELTGAASAAELQAARESLQSQGLSAKALAGDGKVRGPRLIVTEAK